MPGTDPPQADWSGGGERPARGFGESEAGAVKQRQRQAEAYPTMVGATPSRRATERQRQAEACPTERLE